MISPYIPEIGEGERGTFCHGARSVSGVLSKTSSVFSVFEKLKTLLLSKICSSLLVMAWCYQMINIAMTRFVKIGKVCFCCGKPIFLK